MDVNSIITLVGSLGFPIVACAYLAWFTNTTIKEFRESMDRNTDLLKEIKTWIQAIGGGQSHEG